MAFPALNLLVKAIRIVIGEGGSIAPSKTYIDAVLADEPVMFYIGGNYNNTSVYNLAHATADGTNNGTASADVYAVRSLQSPSNTAAKSSFFFDTENGTQRPYISVPWFSERGVSGTDFTFECLMQSFDFDTGGDDEGQQLYCSFDATVAPTDKAFRIVANNSSLQLRHHDGITQTPITQAYAFESHTKYHIAVTVDNQTGGTVSFYVNGVLIGTGDDTLPSAFDADEAVTGYIGAISDTGGSAGRAGYYFYGRLGCIAQYDSILDDATILAHANAVDRRISDVTPTSEKEYYNEILDDAPEGLWRLSNYEQGSNTIPFTDSSGNGLNGTAFGETQTTANPVSSSGMSTILLPDSTTTAGVELPANTNIHIQNSMTVMVSVCPFARLRDGLTTQPYLYTCGDFGTSGHQGFTLRLYPTYLRITYYSAPAVVHHVSSDTFDTTLPFDGTESYHLTVSIDNSSSTGDVIFYIDGVQSGATKALDSAVIQTINVAAKSYIGAASNDSTGFTNLSYHGIIDEVSFHSEILTPERIKGLASLRDSWLVSDLDNYLARYSMDDISGSTAPNHSLTASLDGTLIGSPTTTTGYDDVEDGALLLSGSGQYVDLPSGLEVSGDLSIATWFRFDGTAGSYEGLVDLGSNYSGVRSGASLLLHQTSARPYVIFGDGSGTTLNTNYFVLQSDIHLDDGLWHHVVFTHDGTTAIIYIDGVLSTSVAASMSIGYDGNTHDLHIGNYSGETTPSFPFEGAIDDVRVYERAIGAQEVFYLWATTIPPKPQDMISGWDFEADSTDDIASNDFTTAGTPTYTAGWEDNSLTLNGTTQYGYRTNANSTDFQDSTFSVSCFAKAEALDSNQTVVGCFYQDGASDKYGWVVQRTSTNNYAFPQYDGGSSSINGDDTTAGSATCYLGVWQHLCAVVTPASTKFYIDGILVNSYYNLTGTMAYTDSEFSVGARNQNGSFTTFFEGQIDSLRFFDRAVTAAEVKALALRNESLLSPTVSQPTAPSYTAVTLDIDVASITETVDNEEWTSATLTATPTDGSGQFTYLWTTDGSATINSPTASTTTVTYDGYQEDLSETITCVVTDIGDSDNTASDTCPIAITFGNTNDYIAYWNFDTAEVSGYVVDDQTANGHDMTMTATPVLGTGVDGQSIETSTYDGSYNYQYGEVADHADLKTTTFTAAMWVKPEEIVSNPNSNILSNGDNLGALGYQGVHVVRAPTTGDLKVYVGLGTGVVEGTDYKEFTISGAVPNNTWTHVVVIYNNASIKVYIDGVQEGSEAWATGIAWPSTNYIVLGGQSDGGSPSMPFYGEVDEVKWYDRELSPAEVLELYGLNTAPAVPPTPLTVTINPSAIVDLVFPIAAHLTEDATAVVTGGVGPFTYAWTKIATESPLAILGSTTVATVAFTGSGPYGEWSDTFRCTVTDTGNGNVTAYDDITTIINWGAV